MMNAHRIVRDSPAIIKINDKQTKLNRIIIRELNWAEGVLNIVNTYERSK